MNEKDEPANRSRWVIICDPRPWRRSGSSPLPNHAARLRQARARPASAVGTAPSGATDPITRWPARVSSTPGDRGASIRASTASITCSATVRPKRAIHAFGIGSVLTIVPVAVPSAICAPNGDDSVSVSVSLPSA